MISPARDAGTTPKTNKAALGLPRAASFSMLLERS